MKMEVVDSYEILVPTHIYQTTWQHIPEDCNQWQSIYISVLAQLTFWKIK
jgi:hypothetical protein